jgi:hypothetical protein
MPLKNYGVLVGELTSFIRDNSQNKGKYYHEIVTINVNGTPFTAAIDVDSKQPVSDIPDPNAPKIGVEWRVIDLTVADIPNTANLPNGFNPLVSNDNSGAIDYVRSPFLALPNFWIDIPDLIDRRPRWRWPDPPERWNFLSRIVWRVFSFAPKLLMRVFRPNPASFWTKGNSDQAFVALEAVLNQGTHIYIFGERFANGGNGVHDVHQNQGDPLTSKWAGLNGIWQDGATIVRKENGSFVGFFNKFSSQSYLTDNQGHPV